MFLFFKKVIFAVLPKQAQSVLEPLTNFRPEQVIISLMSGVTLATLRTLVAPATTVVTAIPLPPVQFKAGITVLTPPGTPVTALFEFVGTAVEAEDEKQLQTMFPVFCVMGAHYRQQLEIANWLTTQVSLSLFLSSSFLCVIYCIDISIYLYLEYI